MMTPQIIAKAKSRMTSPPRKNRESSASSVVAEVMTVRDRVSLTDLFNRSVIGRVL